MTILPEATRTTRPGPAEWFTGTVYIDPVVQSAAPARFKANRVTFAPGARTAWHTHPQGQALHVLSGCGLVQLQGKPMERLRSGDSVWIEAGELHWHGADAEHSFVHLAIQEADDAGNEVVWLQHVTSEEYAGI